MSVPPFPWPAGLRERHAERLEDRLEDVLRIVAVDKTHMSERPPPSRQLVEEARDEIGAELADTRLRQVDVRHDEGDARTPRERCAPSASSAAATRRPVTANLLRGQRLTQRLTERLPGRGLPRPPAPRARAEARGRACRSAPAGPAGDRAPAGRCSRCSRPNRRAAMRTRACSVDPVGDAIPRTLRVPHPPFSGLQRYSLFPLPVRLLTPTRHPSFPRFAVLCAVALATAAILGSERHHEPPPDDVRLGRRLPLERTAGDSTRGFSGRQDRPAHPAHEDGRGRTGRAREPASRPSGDRLLATPPAGAPDDGRAGAHGDVPPALPLRVAVHRHPRERSARGCPAGCERDRRSASSTPVRNT